MRGIQNAKKHITDLINKAANAYSANQRRKLWQKLVARNTVSQVLTDEQKAAAVDFFRPYCKISTIAHNYYTEKTGAFCPDYIPDDLHYAYIDPYFNNWKAAKYIDNKCQYVGLFRNITHAENIIWRSNGLWFNDSSAPLTKEQIDEILCQYESAFVKIATDSLGGKGVFFISGEDLVSSFWNRIQNIHSDLVVQKPIVQHESLRRINDSSVNTIRSISLLSESGVVVYSSILRMGINGAKVDNASQGGITCGIDKNGKLKKYAYSAKGPKFLQHPNSNITFEGYAIPQFEKLMEMIPRLHCQIPLFRLVSWDFAIREDGEPVLIEANLCNGEIDFHQLNNGPLFGEDTNRILAEVFQNNHPK